LESPGFGVDVAVLDADARPQGLERLEVLIDRSGADLAAAGERDLGAAVARHERAEHQDARAHLFDHLVGRLGGALTAAHPNPRRRGLDLAAHDPEQLRERVDVVEIGHVPEMALAVAEERGAEDGQRRVLGSADANRAAKRLASDHPNSVHGAPYSLSEG